ncbi:MAG: transporter ATP-binding protein [Herbinix sp.]|jgi:ABC-2 type transport system ATP-binding protein|nr:transporter ATP-binding protein [Herbinix sp.]
MANAIVINHLRKEFGTKTAVNDISLKVETGKIFSLLGVNGAGKTTTIRVLTGLSRPTAGEVRIFDKDIRTELEDIKKLCNLSPQETAIAPNLTVKENLEFIAEIYGFARDEAKEKVKKIIEEFSLEEVESSKAKTLSGGWQRRLSIAMALVTDPKLLFLDEPTLGLDVLARRELWRIIERLKGKITIILTTHYMEEAESLSDAIAIMVKGEIRAQGSVDELKQRTGKNNLEEAFIALAEGN